MNEQYIERYWRDATPGDAIAEPPMVARFRDEHHKYWAVVAELIYWDRSEAPWYRDDGYCYERCQVYDAPDPGEGWRLVDEPEVGDEYMLLFKPELGWKQIETKWTVWSKDYAFRRRIEPPKPKYEPFRWEDREQLRGRLVSYVDRDRTVEFRCESFAVDDGGFSVHHIYSDWLCKNAVFVDTKEPVGRRVE